MADDSPPNLRCPVCGTEGWSDYIMVEFGRAVPLCCPVHQWSQDDAQRDFDKAAESEFVTAEWYACREGSR